VRSARFEALDSCRGVAALMVAISRLEANGYFFQVPLFRNSYLFVDFFFVLSGFVIAHAYGERLRDRTSGISFTIRRFGRLWPLHVAVLALFVLYELVKLVLYWKGAGGSTVPFTGTQSIESIFSNLLLIQALGIYDHLTWNMPSWSISTEFWTYLVFAAVCLTLPNRIVAVSTALIVGGLAVVAIWSPDNMNATNDLGFFRTIAGFFTGVLVYRFWRTRQEPGPTLARSLGWLELAALALVVVFVWNARYTTLSLLAPFVFAVPLFLYAYERGPVSRLLLTRPIRPLGQWSYSIYMVNLFIALMVERAANVLEKVLGSPTWVTVPYYHGGNLKIIQIGPRWAMDILAVFFVAAVLLMSWATYRLIEDPARRYFNRLADRYEARARRKASDRAGEHEATGPLQARPRLATE
jgi:peptidoglycan/LPS O-acetylase OafA/YrhL